MLNKALDYLRQLYEYACAGLARHPTRLAVVRRYQDANGYFVGELYLERMRFGINAYEMIGASLDNMPLDYGMRSLIDRRGLFTLDTTHDFLDLMFPNTLRVGSLTPKDNEAVRKLVRRLPKRNMTLVIQNRFIEAILGLQA